MAVNTTGKTETREVEEAPGPVQEENLGKNLTNYDLVDKEVAQYATETAIEIDEATNKRLKRMIDKRVLLVMMVTYLMQTLDKGALSFASIMGILDDAHLGDNEVGGWFCYLVLMLMRNSTNG
jgi:hypothetical protein